MMPASASIQATAIPMPSCASRKNWPATDAPAMAQWRWPANNRNISREDAPMDFTLSNEQRSWQMAARKFADEEIRPLSLARDAIATARETWDWDIIKKGSKLGFRTMAVPKEWGGQGRQRHFKGLQPELEMEPSDLLRLHRGAEAALPSGLRRRRHLRARQGHHRAERRFRQPPAVGRSQDRAEAARRAQGR